MKLCKRGVYEDSDEDPQMREVICKLKVLSVREDDTRRGDCLVGSLKRVSVNAQKQEGFESSSVSGREGKRKHMHTATLILMPSAKFKPLDLIAATSAYQDLAKLNRSRMYLSRNPRNGIMVYKQFELEKWINQVLRQAYYQCSSSLNSVD